jgi:sterol desaturase/sphingolipid hydroxylase (fatty acid hydroxylase superfamily)
MAETASSWLASLADLLARSLVRVLAYPADPGERIFWLYLLGAAALCACVYPRARRPGARGPRGFLRFCFPAAVWRDPSAWLDVRYFVVHQMLRVWIYGSLALAVGAATTSALAVALAAWLGPPPVPARAAGLAARAAATLFGIALADFAGFLAHTLQHRSPLLWEFHKVHHSLTVMHPLSNYREHWVDNLFYAVVHGVTAGVVASVGTQLLGAPVPVLAILGVNALVFAFDAAGYNLRHSHVWVAWPGWLGHLLGSPAYHQIHHSVDPRHRAKNLAFMFQIWDRLFGSLVLPTREPQELRFGIGDGSEGEYRSILRLWFLPFAKLASRRRAAAAPSPERAARA